MSKKIADINIDDAEFLNDSLMDFYNDDDQVDPLDEQQDTVEDAQEDNSFVDTTEYNNTSLDATEDEDEEDSVETEDDTADVPQPEKPQSFDDYNTLALLALSLQEQDPDLIDFEIDKDIKPEVLITNLKTKLDKTRQEVAQEVEESYGNAARYLNMILEGATDSEVSTALSFNQIASLEITGQEDEAQLEQVVKSWLSLKGSPDIEDLVDIYKDKGVLVEKAREAVEFHKEQEEAYFYNWQQNRNAQIAQAQRAQLEYQKAVKSQIDKGVVKGMAIKDKKRFEESLFKPTELVEFIDDSGQKRLQKVPLIQLKMQAFHQDIEQQLALQLLVLDDFDFSSLVDKAKRKVNNNLINTLNERASVPGTGRKSSSTYFED